MLASAARSSLAAALLACALAACDGAKRNEPMLRVPGGDPDRGRALIAAYPCGSCHTIPGIDHARSSVAPPLTGFAERKYVGGVAANVPENLILWIRNPQALDPRTMMPALGLTEAEARDVAAYLYTLD